MGILERAGLHNLPPMTATTSPASAKTDLRKVGKDTYELLTYSGRRSFRQRARRQTVELKPDKLYTPGEVAALLNVSYDTAVRHMQSTWERRRSGINGVRSCFASAEKISSRSSEPRREIRLFAARTTAKPDLLFSIQTVLKILDKGVSPGRAKQAENIVIVSGNALSPSL
jgi:hypothetical protein